MIKKVVNGFNMVPQNLTHGRFAYSDMPYEQVPMRGLILWWLGITRIHEDGNGWSAVFRPWNPATWILFIVMIPVCAFMGEKIFDVIPMRVSSKHFQKYPEELIWWTPFSKRQGMSCSIPKRKLVSGAINNSRHYQQ
jgi:hypothetical protein